MTAPILPAWCDHPIPHGATRLTGHSHLDGCDARLPGPRYLPRAGTGVASYDYQRGEWTYTDDADLVEQPATRSNVYGEARYRYPLRPRMTWEWPTTELAAHVAHLHGSSAYWQPRGDGASLKFTPGRSNYSPLSYTVTADGETILRRYDSGGWCYRKTSHTSPTDALLSYLHERDDR